MVVLTWLAQNDAKQSAAEWTFGVTLIMVIGAVAVLLLVLLAMSRRWAARQHKAIEEEKQRRRSSRSAGRVDAWRAGSDRYVDRDKLPDELADGEVPFDAGPDGPAGGVDADPPDNHRGPGRGEADEPLYQDQWDERDDRDPYGLFEDKPYQEPDDDEDEDEDDEDFDDELDGEEFDDDEDDFNGDVDEDDDFDDDVDEDDDDARR